MFNHDGLFSHVFRLCPYDHEVQCPMKSNVQYHNAQCIPQAHKPCRLNKTIIKVTLNMCTSCPLPHLSSLLAVAIHHRHGSAYCYCHDGVVGICVFSNSRSHANLPREFIIVNHVVCTTKQEILLCHMGIIIIHGFCHARVIHAGVTPLYIFFSSSRCSC